MSRSILLALAIHLLAMSVSAQDDPQRLRSAVDNWVTKSGNETTAFRHAFTDLDGDGRDDALVLLLGNAWCGTGGCTMLVFRGTATGFTFLSSSELISEPIRVSPEKTSGWKKLIVYVKKLGDVVIPFNGSGYSLEQSGPAATAEQIKAARTVMETCCVSLFTSPVRYHSFHYEQGWVTLQDGQTLHLSFEDIGGLLKQDIEKWPNEKELLIIYSSEKGAGLLDPKSLKSAPILEGLKEHPIDLMADKCFQSDAQTTAEMVACYTKGLAMWDKELNRFYGQLMASLGPAQRDAVQTAQRQWLQYRTAEGIAFGAVDNDGTLSSVSRAMEAMIITKEQAERLTRLLAR